MRALIVEDEPELMAFLSLLLTNAGLIADRTATIDAALSALRTAPFDIAIVDRRLPDGDGLSIVKALSAEETRPAFLILTARDAKTDVIEGLNGGADDYLVKPFEPGELLARLRASRAAASRSARWSSRPASSRSIWRGETRVSGRSRSTCAGARR